VAGAKLRRRLRFLMRRTASSLQLSRGLKALAILAAFLAPLWSAIAAQPPWSELRHPLYAIVPHYHHFGLVEDELTSRQGIWRFDPDSRNYSRLVTFYFNGEGGRIPGARGEWSYLTSLGDRLVFQSWPVYLELDVTTGRVLRRYSPLRAPGYSGWAVRGPGLSESEAASVGLPTGTYGLAFCEAYFYSGDPGPQPGVCGEPLFPPDMGPRSAGKLFHRFGEPDDGRLGFVIDLSGLPEYGLVEPWYLNSPLSFDSARGGLWLGGCHYFSAFKGATFFPIREGIVDVAGRTSKTLPASLCSGEDRVFLLYHDSLTDRFFASATHGTQSKLYVLDSELVLLDTLATWDWAPGGPKEAVPWTLARIPEAPPAVFEQTVPVVANTPGRNGTYWTSDLWFYNPSNEAAVVGIRRVAAPTLPTRTLELLPHGSVRILDALSWVGGGPSGDGTRHDALVLTSPYRLGEQVVGASRTYTLSSDPVERANGGTMGQAVIGVPSRLGYSNHTQTLDDPIWEGTVDRESVLVLDRLDPDRYRHNLGVVNDSDEVLQLTLQWACPGLTACPQIVDGGRQSLTVDPHRVTVTSIEGLFPTSVVNGWPARIGVAGNRPAILFFSMVDNRTGDGTNVPFTMFEMGPAKDSRLSIPAVAHLPGEHNSVWRTDIYGAFCDWENSDLPPTAPRAYFHPARPTENCGGAASTGELVGNLIGLPAVPGATPDLDPLLQWSSIFPDVTRLFAPCQADPNVRGALDVRAASWMSGYARTYSTRTDGGTYGEILPLYPEGGWPVQHFAGIEISAKFRVNLGLYNGDKAHPIVHRLTLYAADGGKVAEREVTLQPWENDVRRLEVWLGLQPGQIADGTYGLTVLPLDDSAHGFDGRSWAFISLIDNVTNDPTNWW
jgi:hypothetical protein